MSNYKVVSVDDHLIEPPDLFEGRLPSKLQQRAPKVIELDNLGRPLLQLRWEPAFEEVGRLDEVVVDGDDLVVGYRSHSSSRRSAWRMPGENFSSASGAMR